jgi:pimeloyl-ACP methyl ester carboxylesterase
MVSRRTFTAALAAASMGTLEAATGTRMPRLARAENDAAARNVVLVHGLFADGSCWSDVIARLQAAGLSVTSVQNPLTTLDDAVAETRPAGWADRASGAFLLRHDRDGGRCRSESFRCRLRRGAGPGCGRGLHGASQEISYTARIGTKVLYAVQQPFHKALLSGKTKHAAWRSKPSFYAVSTEDRTINPDLERFMAKRMGAKTIEVKASHLSLISHPHDIANLILEAAGRSVL